MADNPAQLNAAGLAAMRQGDMAAAQALFARAAAADPASALLWYNLSTAHCAAGDRQAEAAALDAALDRDPYFDHALLARGQLHLDAGEDLAALHWFERLLAAHDPREPYGPGFGAGLAMARKLVADHKQQLGARLDAALAPAIAAAGDKHSLRFRHFVDAALGRRRIYTHQPLVLHYPYLPAEQFFDRDHFPWLAELEAATPVIRAELEALLAAGGEGFAPYVAYPPGAPVNQWATLNHNDAWSAQHLIEHGTPQPVLSQHCPKTAALLEKLPLFDLPGRGPVAFFSLLKPHTHIPPHTGSSNARAIIHLPLIVPAGCTFRVGNETREWQQGEAFAFDDSIEHEAWNNSGELRAVLILDTWNPHIAEAERTLLRQYIAEIDASAKAVTF